MELANSNLLSILKWSLGQQQQTDGTVESSFSSLSVEDKAFLSAALSEAIKDEPSRLEEILKKFVSSLESVSSTNLDEDQMLLDMEELREIVEQIDMAEIFAKRRGLECLLAFVANTSLGANIRGLAASTIATMSQHNPRVQTIALDTQVTTHLVSLLHSLVVDHPRLAAKVLSAVSCLIRGDSLAEGAFIEHGGADILHSAMKIQPPDSNSTQDHALASRATFLLYCLLTSDHASETRCQALLSMKIQDTAANPNFTTNVVSLLADCLRSDDLTLREFALRCLIASHTYECGKQQLVDSKEFIEMRIKAQYDSVAVPEKADQYEEEHTLVTQLRQLLLPL